VEKVGVGKGDRAAACEIGEHAFVPLAMVSAAILAKAIREKSNLDERFIFATPTEALYLMAETLGMSVGVPNLLGFFARNLNKFRTLTSLAVCASGGIGL